MKVIQQVQPLCGLEHLVFRLRGESLTEKCDVYALGRLITELYGERLLWPSMSVHQVMFKVGVDRVFPTVAHLPVAVRDIVNTMCFIAADMRASVNQILCAFLDLQIVT